MRQWTRPQADAPSAGGRDDPSRPYPSGSRTERDPGLADDLVEGGTERAGLLGVQLDDQPAPALERDSHDDAAPLLGDLERTIARPRLHRRHAHTSSCDLPVFYCQCDRAPSRRAGATIIAHIPRNLTTTWGAGCGRLRGMHARSALFDLYGDHLRARGGRAPVAALVRILAPLGITAPAVRTAISRMVRQGWLSPVRLDDGPGYTLTDRARQRLDEAAARIYRTRSAAWEGTWDLVVVGPVPHRAARERLRSG